VTPPEPTLGEVRDELKGALEHDKRLRYVEVEVATLSAQQAEIKTYLPRMEDRLISEIQTNKPKRASWPTVVSAAVASVALILAIAQPLYGG